MEDKTVKTRFHYPWNPKGLKVRCPQGVHSFKILHGAITERFPILSCQVLKIILNNSLLPPILYYPNRVPSYQLLSPFILCLWERLT